MSASRRLTKASRLLLCLLLALTLISAGGAPYSIGLASASTPVDPRVTSPKGFFGYDIGTDYNLTPWTTRTLPDYNDPSKLVLRKGIVEYAYELQRTSNRVRVFQEGTSSMGRPMILTVITSPDNWAQMANLKAILRKLADPRQVPSDGQARTLAAQGKAVYWISAAIHSSERTSPEVLLRLGYHLASGQDDWTKQLLDNVVVVLENTINPDGLDQVTDAYYNRTSAPGYGKYVNHDDNRDFLGAGLVETQQNIQARFEWNPTVYHDLHQAKDMLYMSPGNDPTNDAVSPITMDEWTAFAGHNIGQLTSEGWKGAFTWDYADMWYPGYNHGYSFMHNTNGRFYELQGASLASPSTLGAGAHSITRLFTTWGASRTWWDPAPYSAGYSPSGDGKWHLMDAVNLEEDALKNDLTYTMNHKDDLLMNFYLKGKTNQEKASGQAPYAFVIPANGGDNADVTDLINNLHVVQHIEVDRLAQNAVIGGRQFAAGDFVVRMDQPYGLTAKNLLSVQTYPPIKEPYDVTAWTYGLMRDVEVVSQADKLPAGLKLIPVTAKLQYAGTLTGGVSSTYIVENGANNNLAVALPRLWANTDVSVSQSDSAFTDGGRNFPAGTFVVRTTGSAADHAALQAIVQELGLVAYSATGAPGGIAPLAAPKVAVYARYDDESFSDTSEGWLRIQLDNAGWSYTRLHPAQVKTMGANDFDVIIVPSISTNTFANAIGTVGLANVRAFVEAGGTLVMQGSSSRLPIDKGWISGVTVAPSAPAGMLAPSAAVQAESENEEYLPDFGGPEPPAGQRAAAALGQLVAAQAGDVPLNCPGSVVRVNVDPATRVGYGFDPTESMWCESSLFFDVAADASVATVASYPDDGNTVLQSGYISGESWMHGKAAIVDAPLGSGHLVMIAPNVVYRAQTTGSYMFLWNALLEGSR